MNLPLDGDETRALSEVQRVLPAGRSGFLKDYVTWAVTQTDAPPLYHVACAVTVLSASMPATTAFQMGAMVTKPNMFTMIVGAAGADRKSTCCGLSLGVLSDAAPNRVGPSPGSPEGLVESLRAQPLQIISEEEWSRFAAQSKGGGYLGPLKSSLMQAYDGRPISRRLAQSSVEAREYRLSLLAACNRVLLLQHSTPEDITGGLYPRFLVVDASRDWRYLQFPKDDPEHIETRAHLVDALRRSSTHGPAGVFRLSSEARAACGSWSELLDEKARAEKDSNPMVSSLHMRAAALGIRLAVVYAYDRYLAGVKGGDTLPDPIESRKEQFTVERRDMLTACLLVDEHLASCSEFATRLVSSREMRMVRDVLDKVPDAPPGKTRGQLSRETGLLKRQIQPVLDTLLDRLSIAPFVSAGPPRYYRTTPGRAVQINQDQAGAEPPDPRPRPGASPPGEAPHRSSPGSSATSRAASSSISDNAPGTTCGHGVAYEPEVDEDYEILLTPEESDVCSTPVAPPYPVKIN